MSGGYMGSILVVNLTGGQLSTRPLDLEWARAFIGGSGLAARYFYDDFDPGLEPLSPRNTLYLLTGPLCGTHISGSSRFAVCARSPLTGIWAESTCGGNFGPELRFAGFDGIFVQGAAERPTVLLIDDGKPYLLDGEHLWGKDTYQTVDALKREIPGKKKVKVLCIGQAGENLVRMAAICNDKHSFAGRCGLGAVMGSKKLKAIAVRGSKKVPLSDPEAYARLQRETTAQIKQAPVSEALRLMGTDSNMDLGMMTGDVPIENWSRGEDLELSASLGGPALTEKHLVGKYACFACVIACKRVTEIKDGPHESERGPGPEYETCCTFGTMINNPDLSGVVKANEWCNRYGLDTISTGATLAWAVECFERGLLSREQTGGVELRFGDIDGVIELLHKVAHCEGLIGELLSEGSRRAAARLGQGSERLTCEVKGLECPMHDPRGWHGMGLAYMMSNRGACHLQHAVHGVEYGITSYPEVGFEADYPGQSDEGKGKMVKLAEDWGLPCNALALCEFDHWCMSAPQLIDLLNAVTGFGYTLEGFLEAGARNWLLKRALNNLMGVTVADDRLPEKSLTPLAAGGAAGSVPEVEKLRREYYEERGLDQRGWPLAATLARADLGFVADRLRAAEEG